MADISRTSLERVLARATELQSTTEPTETISEERLLEIAKEVGIDLSHVRQAVAEERARSPMAEDEHGAILDALGPSVVSAQRTVPGTPASILSKLDAWMPRMESLTTCRRIGDRLSWEPRRDSLGNALRAIGIGGRRFDLVRLDQVVASVHAVDGTRSVIRFDAEASGVRRSMRSQMIGIGVLLTLAFIVLALPLAVLLPSGAGMGVGVAGLAAFTAGLGAVAWRAIRRSYRNKLDRVHLRLEQLLDELEHDRLQDKPGLMEQLTGRLLSNGIGIGIGINRPADRPR